MPKKEKSDRRTFDPRTSNSHMALLENMRSLIEKGISEGHLSIDELAEHAHMHPQTIKRLLSGKTLDPRLSTPSRLLEGVGAWIRVGRGSSRRDKRKR